MANKEATTEVNHRETGNKTVALSAYSLVFTGIAMILLSVLGAETWHWADWVVHFVRDLGLLMSAVMAGTIFHEKLLRDEMWKRFNEELDGKFSELPDQVSKKVHRLFSDRPPTMTGIRKLSDVRRNYGGYYHWVDEQKPQELFFAGRSVLHRIDADIRARHAGSSAEQVILRKLGEGSKINILFLDPRIDIIERLAQEEGQTLDSMLGDISTSLAICRKIADSLQSKSADLPPGAELSIRVYDRIPYFAYHKQDSDIIVGFYFDSEKGSTSAAYELVDEETKGTFEEHFVRIKSESAKKTIVEFDGARARPAFMKTFVDDLEAVVATSMSKH